VKRQTETYRENERGRVKTEKNGRRASEKEREREREGERGRERERERKCKGLYTLDISVHNTYCNNKINLSHGCLKAKVSS